MAVLPWAMMLVATIAGIVGQSILLWVGRSRWRGMISLLALCTLALAWSLIIVSSGPQPAISRAAMLPWVRGCVLVGACLLLAADMAGALLAVRRSTVRRARD